MTSLSAKPDLTPLKKSKADARLVVFVVYPNIVLLDLVGPLQVFTHALSSLDEIHGYDTVIVSKQGGSIETNTLVSIETDKISSVSSQAIHTLIVVGGDGAYQAMHDIQFVDAIKELALGAERVCSVCSGALILAAAGLLNGRRAVTHWEDCQQLRDEFPEVMVELDPIFIKDGNVWTSAGITAGMDLALAVVAEDLGRQAAMNLARSMVVPMVRSGGQSQFSPILDWQSLDSTGRFDALHQWIAANLTMDLRVEDLAARVNMSPRNFSRAYSSQMKVTPAKAVEAIRIEASRGLLETTSLGLKEIAQRCGFGDDERMRRAFMRTVKTPPGTYRARFHQQSENGN